MSSDTPPARHGRRRRLTAEEELLWSTVARSVRPLRAQTRTTAATKPEDAVTVTDATRSPRPAPEPKAAQPSCAPPASPPGVIARREKQQLARGRVAIDGRLDLHGMSQAEAHRALLQFLHGAQARGAKFVLVITGKGTSDAPRGRGVLRRQVPLWLGLPEFRSCIVGFDVAHLGHGGDGALYVRLRKRRA